MAALRTKLVAAWFKAWKLAAPSWRVPGTDIRLRPSLTDAPLRALMSWRPDWKTRAIAGILRQRPGALIDVGANVGQTLLDFLAAGAERDYIGFEPNISCSRHLTELVAANRLGCCRVIPAGLAEASGVRPLFLFGGDADAGASIRRELRPACGVRSRDAAFYRLDDLCELIGDKAIALIKIDVEGGELEALRGMERTVREKQPWILCEVLHRDAFADAEAYKTRCGELASFIAGIGYEAHRLVMDAKASRVTGLERIGGFPDAVWHDSSPLECEYLLVPAGNGEAAREALL